MDIGHDLFYNENTVHSGDFLENRTGFGKETMRKKIRINTAVLLLCVLLCGCTRREQLILETAASEQEQQAVQEQTLEDAQTIADQDENIRQAAGRSISGQQVPEGAEQTDSTLSRENAVIYVHVCGAVEKPDVYELPAGSRVYEAVKAAGGFTEDADENYVNQAQTLSDGVKLVIPTWEQTEAVVSEGVEDNLIGIVGDAEDSGNAGIPNASQDNGVGADHSVSDGKININTASEAELCNIPGIGAARAAAIIAYRQEKGGFSSIEDIMNVSGIKGATYEKIKDSIKIN